MKSNLSPLEELKAEKERLRMTLQQQEEKIMSQLVYVKSNWGTLLFQSVISSSVKKGSSLFGSSKKGNKSGLLSIVDTFSTFMPFVWSIAQPLLLGVLTKKIKSFFFRKKK